QAFQKHMAVPVGQGKPCRAAAAAHRHGLNVDKDFSSRRIAGVGHYGLNVRLAQRDQQKPVIHGVGMEYLCETRRDHGLYAELLQSPDGVLATGPTAKIRACHQYAGVRVLRPVQDEVIVLAALLIETHIVKDAGIQAAFVDAPQELLGHDLVSVQVGQRQRGCHPADKMIFTHTASCMEKVRTSVMAPVMAAAAAMAGLIKCVMAPRPWRPSKFRLVVDAQRCPGASTSSFIARHIEQPGCRHSNPAWISTSARPSCSAWARTAPEPGTTIALTPSATLLPRANCATIRRSSIRPLVHEPMKTCCTGTPCKDMPPDKPVYRKACCIEALL